MRHFTLLVSMLLCGFGFAQEKKQFNTSVEKQKAVLDVEKTGIMKDIKLIANTRYSLSSYFADAEFQSSGFRMNELRMEVVGKLSDRFRFRFRDVYSNRPVDQPPTTDGLRYSVDLAFCEYDLSPKVSVAAGKMFGEWGSYEFEQNPIYMYGYNHLTGQAHTLFLSGVNVRWKVSAMHSLTFQMTNSTSRNIAHLADTFPSGVEPAKAYLGQTVNWRGKFLNNEFGTKWSFSHFNMAKNKHVYLLEMGNQYKTNKLLLQYDFKYSMDDIDRLGYVTSLLSKVNEKRRAMDVSYMEHWLRAQYSFTDRWSCTAIGMTNTQYWREEEKLGYNSGSTLGTSYSFTLGLEYILYKPYNLMLFTSYVGRYNRYTLHARQGLGLNDNNTGQFFVGIICPLVLY